MATAIKDNRKRRLVGSLRDDGTVLRWHLHFAAKNKDSLAAVQGVSEAFNKYLHNFSSTFSDTTSKYSIEKIEEKTACFAFQPFDMEWTYVESAILVFRVKKREHFIAETTTEDFPPVEAAPYSIDDAFAYVGG